ncbi:hypothetical protein LXD69_06185 [Flavobacterium sediminilitoris]|uniref:Collagen triple helix repeat protein n=1 Tax=Flavobacterium sediminilitoris TaxID=2024526 RepID=A0ABY4HQF2_9FLAO|nr:MULTISPECIES: hypothetical protein [Flavobacterium]UOX35098.1 hypothetical protein LXD69_06185 [Flavobacterium sediminilitoris]
MKNRILLFVFLLIGMFSYSQSPEGFTYQGVVRDASDALVTNSSIGMRISILQTSPSGTAIYVETQTPTSNINGLVSLEIGSGTVVSGSIAAIDWSAGPYFIKTEADPTGGTNYTVSGISQMMSVPYALYAANSAPGPQGPAGADGLDGATGPMGPQGPAGNDGLDGATGPMGPQGPAGNDGLDGATGPMGPQGPAGADGLDGATGPMGPQGPAGNDGLDGATGPMGPQGPAGADGLDGATGPMGPQGPAGNDGLDGATGPMGPQGPAGLDGADGATGPVGPQGPAGNDGLDGATGPMGPQGPAGADGLDGATGPMGPQGPAGNDGLDGATGPMGPQGPAGLDGADGATGPVGPQGPQGPEGPAGTYTAGSGIDITGSVISATGGSSMPEYAYASIGNSSTLGAQTLTAMFPAATYVNGVVMNGSSITLHANKMYEVTVAFYIYNATGGHTYKMKDATNSAYLGTEIYFGQGGSDISYNMSMTNFLFKPSTDVNLELEKTQGTNVNLIGRIVVKEIK